MSSTIASFAQRMQDRMAEGRKGGVVVGMEPIDDDVADLTCLSRSYRPASFCFPLKHTLADFLASESARQQPTGQAPSTPATESPFARVEDTPMWLRLKNLLTKLEGGEQVRQQIRNSTHDGRREVLKAAHGVDLGGLPAAEDSGARIKRRAAGGGASFIESNYEGSKADGKGGSPASRRGRSVRIKSTAELFDYNTMVPTTITTIAGSSGGPSSSAGTSIILSPSRAIIPLVDATRSNAGPLRRLGSGGGAVVEGALVPGGGATGGSSGPHSAMPESLAVPLTKEEMAERAKAEEAKAERERVTRALETSLNAFGLPYNMFGLPAPPGTVPTAVVPHQQKDNNTTNPKVSAKSRGPASAAPVVVVSPDVVQGYFAVKTLLNPLPSHDAGLVPFIYQEDEDGPIAGTSSGNSAKSKSSATANQHNELMMSPNDLADPLAANSNAHTTASVRIAISAIKFWNQRELEQRCQHLVAHIQREIRERTVSNVAAGGRGGGGGGKSAQSPPHDSFVSIADVLYALHSSISPDPSKHHHATSPQFQRYLRSYLFSTSTATIQHRLANQLRSIRGVVIVKTPGTADSKTKGAAVNGDNVLSTTITPFSTQLSGVLEGAFKSTTDMLNPASGARGSAAMMAAAEMGTATIAAIGALSGATTIHVPSHHVEGSPGAVDVVSPQATQRDTLQYIQVALRTVAKRIAATHAPAAAHHGVSGKATTTSRLSQDSNLLPSTVDQRQILLQAGMQLGLVGNQYMRVSKSVAVIGGTAPLVPRSVTKLELQTHAFYRDRHVLPDTCVPPEVVAALRSHSWSEYNENQKGEEVDSQQPLEDLDEATNASSGTILPSKRGSGDITRQKSLLSFRGPLGRSTVASKRASLSGSPAANGIMSTLATGVAQAAVAPVRMNRATKLVNTSRRTKVLFQTHASGFGSASRWGSLSYVLYGIRPGDFAVTKEHLARLQRQALRRHQRRAHRRMMGIEEKVDGSSTSDGSGSDDGRSRRKHSESASVLSRSLSRMMSTLSARGGNAGGVAALPRTNSSHASRRFSASSIFTTFDDEEESGAQFDGFSLGGRDGGGGPPAAFLRRYVGPTPDGTSYLYYPQSKLPLLKGSRPDPLNAPSTTTDHNSGHHHHAASPHTANNETTLLLASATSGKATISGTSVVESHWFSFLGIVFDGTSCRQRLLGKGNALGVTSASATGRLLYYTMVFIPAFSGRDVTSYFLSKRSCHNVFDFGDIGPRDAGVPATSDSSSSDGGGESTTAASVIASMLEMGKSSAKNDMGARTTALLEVLALFLHDFEVVGLLEGGSALCKIFPV